jgi:hypothetical protein
LTHTDEFSIKDAIKVFELGQLDTSSQYIINFDTIIPLDNNIRVEISDENGTRLYTESVRGIGNVENRQVVFTTSSLRRKYKIIFSKNTGDISKSASVKNISIFKNLSPQLFFINNTKTVKTENQSKPRISVDKVNTTRYIIHISSSTEPFVLIFKQSFSPLWEARYLGTQSSIGHFAEAGAFNGWYIDKRGNYDIELTFKPQKLYNYGVVLTITTLFIVTFMAFYRRNKK